MTFNSFVTEHAGVIGMVLGITYTLAYLATQHLSGWKTWLPEVFLIPLLIVGQAGADRILAGMLLGIAIFFVIWVALPTRPAPAQTPAP